MSTMALSPARPIRLGLIVGVAGIALSGIGFAVDPRQAYASWLAALACALSLALGALLLVAVTHITGARWFDPLRRVTLDVAATFPLLAVFFAVLLTGVGKLYPWAQSGGAPSATGAWLSVPFFVGRAAVYFAIWIGVSLMLRRWALHRGRAALLPPSARERVLAAASLPALGLSLTFAAFDWLLSLSPGWVSTVFGVYWFAGGFLAALALDAFIAARRRDRGSGEPLLTPKQAYPLGTLMLTFALFWAYIAYCQYFIIWIGDVPAEVAWYIPRLRGSWGGLALVLLVGQFVLPFLILLFRRAKVSGYVLALVGALLLAMHYADTYWLVLPVMHPDGMHPHWLDLSALAAVGGTGTAWAAWLHAR